MPVQITLKPTPLSLVGYWNPRGFASLLLRSIPVLHYPPILDKSTIRHDDHYITSHNAPMVRLSLLDQVRIYTYLLWRPLITPCLSYFTAIILTHYI